MLTFLTRTKTADFRFWTLIGSLNIGMSNVLEDPSSEDIALIKKIYMLKIIQEFLSNGK